MEEKESQKKQKGQQNNNYRIDILMIYNAKELGLSFEEINELRMKDLVAMLDIKIESFADIKNDSKNNQIRNANQKDIDSFLT